MRNGKIGDTGAYYANCADETKFRICRNSRFASREALSRIGLPQRRNFSRNRPALDPWHCGGLYPAGKMARGRMCETVKEN